MYQAPECLAPLQVDTNKVGKDSDHNVILLQPKLISNNRKHSKKKVVTRPLTDNGTEQFAQFICTQTWDSVLNETDIDKKVTNFHKIIRAALDKHLP